MLLEKKCADVLQPGKSVTECVDRNAANMISRMIINYNKIKD